MRLEGSAWKQIRKQNMLYQVILKYFTHVEMYIIIFDVFLQKISVQYQ